MKYQNTRNGRIAKVVEKNEKFNTVMLEFEDGSTQNITSSTFKRWWKKIAEEETVEETKEVETPVEFTEEKEAEPEVKKPVQKKVKKQKTERKINDNVQKIFDYLLNKVEEMGGTVFVPSNGIKMRSFKVSGHMFGAINYGYKSLRYVCRKAAIEEEFTPDKEQNHLFDAIFVFTELDTEKIDKLLQLCFDDQVLKNEKTITSKKSKKKEEED